MARQDQHSQPYDKQLTVKIHGYGETAIFFGSPVSLHNIVSLAARKLHTHAHLGIFSTPGDYRLHLQPDKNILVVTLLKAKSRQ